LKYNPRRTRWAGHITLMGQMINSNGILIAKPEEKAPPKMPKRRWEDNFKMNLKGRG
jgi:hypothetical protein